MDVSVIIVNYNTFDLTKACIESINQHTSEISYEIILVDNASTNFDATIFSQLYPKIKLICSSTNIGFSKGNNLGIKHAKGKYILLLNSDTVLKNNAIKMAHDYLESHPKSGAVSARLLFPNGQHQSVCQRFPSVRYSLFELFRLQKIFPKKIVGKILLGAFFDHDEEVQADWIWGTFFMFSKNLLGLMPEGKLNDDFFMYCEDMQWCWDIKKLGYELNYYPKAEVIHYMEGSSGQKQELMKQNHKVFMENNYGFIHRWSIDLIDRLLKVK